MKKRINFVSTPADKKPLQRTFNFPTLVIKKKLMERKFDLDDRLINFAVSIIELAELLPQTLSAKHMADQVIRSGTAPALHYGEAQAGESRKDFVHKMKIALKELRETFSALRIIRKANWLPMAKIDPLLEENNQLIAIFVRSIDTATKNDQKTKRIANQEQRATHAQA